MDVFINFILGIAVNNIYTIILILAVALILFIMTKMGYGRYVDSALLYLVHEAEEQYGSGTGAIKKAAVITWIYEKLPPLARLFFTKEKISELVDNAVIELDKNLREQLEKQGTITTPMSIETTPAVGSPITE